MSRPIPEVRTELHEIARAIEENRIVRAEAARQVRALANDLHRESPVRRAPVNSNAMTPQLAERIRTYARARPQVSQLKIAVVFGVNQGRVSEAMNGKR
jgi:hypothetical protein